MQEQSEQETYIMGHLPMMRSERELVQIALSHTYHIGFEAPTTPQPAHSALYPTTLPTLPEEIRQEIISYLDYHEAWSLKQTSKLFLQVSLEQISYIKSQFKALSLGASGMDMDAIFYGLEHPFPT